MKSIIKLMLSPSGRIDRKPFWIGFAGFVGFALLVNFLMARVEQQGAREFWLGLLAVFLFFQMMYGIYGKRLHDMGRTFWPLTGCIILTILILITGMMVYGGSEYFSEFAQYDRKDTIDPARREAITKAYQARLSESEKVLGPILSGLWIAFTLWVGFSKPEPKANLYGPPS